MTVTAEQAAEVLAKAECVADEGAVQSAYARLAEQICADYQDKNPLLLVVVVGAIVPAAELAKRLQFPLEMDYLHVTRYGGQTVGGELTWKRRPDKQRLSGRHLLIIDDVFDHGHTLTVVREALTESSPASIAAAVLVEKRLERPANIPNADYVGLQLPDRYLFGCGMDYKEHWRHLPAIYAIGADAQESA